MRARVSGTARRRLTPEERLIRQTTEADFLRQVIDVAHVFGYRVAHFRPAWSARGYRTPVQGDGVGFPDLVLVGRGTVVVAELKREAAPDPAGPQAEWLDAFRAAGIRAYVWRPSQLEWIAAVLADPVAAERRAAS